MTASNNGEAYLTKGRVMSINRSSNTSSIGRISSYIRGLKSSQGSSSIPPKNGNSILIVDDEKFNCDIVDSFLGVLGFKSQEDRVDHAYNGETAIMKV